MSRMLDSASVGGFKVSLSLYATEEVEAEVEAEGRGIKGKTVYPDLARCSVRDWPVAFFFSILETSKVKKSTSDYKLTFTSTDNDHG